MVLAFVSLLVIPHIKLNNRGLFNVDKFEFYKINIKLCCANYIKKKIVSNNKYYCLKLLWKNIPVY